MRTLRILAVAPYGYIRDVMDMSSGAVGTKARLLGAAMLVGSGRIPVGNLVVVFPQKHGKSDVEYSGHQQSLGEMAMHYLRSRPEMADVRMVAQNMGWGTKQDVMNTYVLAQNIFEAGSAEGPYDSAHFYFVSDPVHIRRIELIWNRVRPAWGKASFFGTPLHRMSWWERRVLEPLARLKVRRTVPRRIFERL
jgi:hypothetical protein